MRRFIFFFFGIGGIVLLLFQGCASTTSSREERVIRETTSEAPSAEGNMGNFEGGRTSPEMNAQEAPIKVEKTTEIRKEEHSSSEPHGVLGTSFHLIGQILAFPFKLIAGVIEFIF